MTTEQVRQLVREANPVPDPQLLHWFAPSDAPDLLPDEPAQPVTRPVGQPPSPSPRRPWRKRRFVEALAVVLAWVGLMLVLDAAPPPASRVASPPPVADVTLTDAGCTAVPSKHLRPGTARFTVRNDSSSPALFELSRLNVTYQAAEFLLGGERVEGGIQRLPSSDMWFLSDVDGSQVLVRPGTSNEVAGDLTAGMYTVLCVPLNDASDRDHMEHIPSGPITVTE